MTVTHKEDAMDHDAMPHLGDLVEDTVTGITGTAVAHTTWLTGCDTVQVQPRVLPDGTVPEGRNVDVLSVKVTECRHRTEPLAPAVPAAKDKGGPRSLAPRIPR